MPAKAPPKRSLSVKKRARQNEKRRLYNRAVISKVKTLSKKVIASVDAKDKGKLELSFKEAVKAVTKAVSKGVLQKNTASRKLSQLSKLAEKALKPKAA